MIMEREPTVLQVIPHLPGSNGGVGDYALALAERLLSNHALRTVFVVAGDCAVEEKEGFKVISGLPSALSTECHHVILHYANYGYQRRGLPFGLLQVARQLRRRLPGRWITMFHEIYASGPPWRSAFWTRPFQVKIARDLINLSNSCVVSNDVIKREIERYDPGKNIFVLPVMSNFGEPVSSELWPKREKRWVICGGTSLIERSLRALGRIHRSIPPEFYPQEIEIVGGTDTAEIRHQLKTLGTSMPGVMLHHHPEVTVAQASTLLAPCSFGWLDYFGTGRAWPGMILKSSSFSALCAHGVVPILSHAESILGIGSDMLPGPFFCTPSVINFPKREQLAATGAAFHAWYGRNASATRSANVYAGALK